VTDNLREISYRDAVREAIREALRADPRVFLMGEDIGRYVGCYAVTKGLLDEFGPERIRDTPLSESAFVGAGIGAALGGMLPIVEIMTVNFSLLALDQIVNNAATIRHMSGGQFAVPSSFAWPPAPAASWRRSIRTVSKAGMRISRASRW
jgi:pyruvate/2-oxoglutarate/acetoin dehydrogenase E1 component